MHEYGESVVDDLRQPHAEYAVGMKGQPGLSYLVIRFVCSVYTYFSESVEGI